MPSVLKSHRSRAIISFVDMLATRGQPAEGLKMLRLGFGGLLLIPLIIAFFYHDDDSELREAAGGFTIVLTNYIGDTRPVR